MEELRIKIEKILAENGLNNSLEVSIQITETIQQHKIAEIKECPRCLSSRKTTYLTGFHHVCSDCGHKY